MMTLNETVKSANGAANQYRGILWGIVILLVLGGWAYTARSVERLDGKLDKLIVRLDARITVLEGNQTGIKYLVKDLERRLNRIEKED